MKDDKAKVHPIHQPHSRIKEGTHTLGISLSHNFQEGTWRKEYQLKRCYPRALNLGRRMSRRVHHQERASKREKAI
jgi:hypothetical protein